ncbi:glycoside hydrolase family 28 protein [Sphingobacterium sp. BN32]|uniref:glycoside hydrolase family 28 protein n=1 Tax=Sphingobacterium sp. BN32 TaxID=3058432 RepID=UPI00265D1366|nr:glycosyl hydrolase family 28 protein [Sphingobacterium sp. BN32]WKK57899.1 glycosyl hydrolase family 28 protein [Sphingobacterium sp. BN32]
MKKLNIYLTILCTICSIGFLQAKDYNASFFGIKSNGTTLNTTSIQRAIDFISENGGGTLKFYVGRYLTGTIHMKSNVTLHLEEGAVLLGSTNINDYNVGTPNNALVYAKGVKNVGITGKGVIDGQGKEVAYSLMDYIHKGIIKDPLDYDRPRNNRPKAIYFRECNNVTIKHVTVKNSADWVQTYDQCEDVLIDSITVDSKVFWNNDGIDIVDCKNFKLLNSYIDASDDAICLKSHDATKMNENIEIRNCVARSSANGIKFGTVSAGGYKNIRIINNRVYDTFRSAFTIATPDGGKVEDVLVDSLYAYNTGNAIYLRIGARWNKGRQGSIDGVTMQNIYIEVPADKPDVGYAFEGPVEDNPRNISPASIVGLKGQPIKNVVLRNVEIVYPGGSNPNYAFRGTSPKELDSIPEMEAAYPEFSQFKELPAWAFYLRHVEGVTFENVKFTAKDKEYRPAVVMDDVKNAQMTKVEYNEPNIKGKKQLVLYKSTLKK